MSDTLALQSKVKSLETLLKGIDGTIANLEKSQRLVATRMRREAAQIAEINERLLRLENKSVPRETT